MRQKKILVVKFGGLGDVVLSLDAMYSIYKHFGNVSLLTEEPFDKLLKKSKWFKEIFTIKRSKFYFYDIYKFVVFVIFCNNFTPVRFFWD